MLSDVTRLCVLFLVVTALTACGQSGDLFIPEEPTPAQQEEKEEK